MTALVGLAVLSAMSCISVVCAYFIGYMRGEDSVRARAYMDKMFPIQGSDE